MGMHDADRLLSDAAALVQAEHDADLRSDAREVFLAEAARCRLADRQGRGQVLLRCGVRLDGEWCPHERIVGCVTLLGPDGRRQLVAEEAIVLVTGTRSALRVEATGREATLGRWLREAWDDGDILRALDASGGWHAGPVAFVGADHVAIETDMGAVVLPTGTVQAWSR
jgi:hypothetical protein